VAVRDRDGTIVAKRRRALAVGFVLPAALLLALAAPTPVAAATSWSVPVLMYHHVRPASEVPPKASYPGLYVSTKRFEEHMAALEAWGWHSISTRDLAVAMKAGRSLPQRSIVISFDDGRPDNYRYAAPILEKHGFRGVFYIVAGRVDVIAGAMTSQQLLDLASRGHEIANHTWSHPSLTSLSYTSARSQIRRAQNFIESLTGLRPVSIAYPYGNSNSTVRSAVAAEGLYLGFVTDGGYRETVANRLSLHRVRVAGVHRRSDGTFGGGETAAHLLADLARYAGPVVSTPSSAIKTGVVIGSSSVQVRTSWTSRDPVGVASHRLVRRRNAGSWTTMTLASRTARSFTASLAFGQTYRYRVRATNAVGVTSPYTYGPSFDVQLLQETSGDISWSGDWLAGTLSGYSGGNTSYTTVNGASATLTFTGSSIAWISKQGPTRGSAEVYVDGQLVTRLSLYAGSFANRYVAFAKTWAANAEHTLTIVCLGTPGHERVDVDAFVVLVNH